MIIKKKFSNALKELKIPGTCFKDDDCKRHSNSFYIVTSATNNRTFSAEGCLDNDGLAIYDLSWKDFIDEYFFKYHVKLYKPSDKELLELDLFNKAS